MATARENRIAALKRATASPKHPRQCGMKKYIPKERRKKPFQKAKEQRRERLKNVVEGNKFEVIDWSHIDQRPHRVKEVKKIITELSASCKLDSYQKRQLANSAAFIICFVRNEELKALAGEPFNQSKYTSLVSKLQGILTVLGMEDKNAEKFGLAEHIAKQAKRKKKPVKALSE